MGRRHLKRLGVAHDRPMIAEASVQQLLEPLDEIGAGCTGTRPALRRNRARNKAEQDGLVARAIAAERGPGTRTPGADLIKRFEELLDARFRDHWPVVRYAEALKVTPTHLSRLTRAVYGCPASHMIRDRIVREARRHLVYTNLSISEIAYALGFDDPAYFSRTFAGATGLSPRDFRDRVHSL